MGSHLLSRHTVVATTDLDVAHEVGARYCAHQLALHAVRPRWTWCTTLCRSGRT